MENLRRVEKRENNEWKQVRMSELKKDDIFRLFDDYDDPVQDGKQNYIATGESFLNDENVWEIEANTIEGETHEGNNKDIVRN